MLHRTEKNQLIENREIIQHQGVLYAVLQPGDTQYLQQSIQVNNEMWGEGLTSTIDEFEQRANNGIVIAAIKDCQVIGTISAMQVSKDILNHLTDPKHWASTWNGITANGTLARHNPQGDILICVAISVLKDPKRVSKSKTPAQASEPVKELLTAEKMQAYIVSGKDIAIRFHEKPKAGYSEGAKVRAIIPGGRPEDTSSLGYNVLMKYPTLNKLPIMTENTQSVAVHLVEASLLYAFQHGIYEVYPYSRPAQLNKYFYL